MSSEDKDILSNSQDFTAFKHIGYTEENASMIDHNNNGQSFFKEIKKQDSIITDQDRVSPLKSRA